MRSLGPGLVTGASDDDPSGVATYSQAGASFGLGLVWTALATLPLTYSVQEICDRTALATGQGLGELTARRFARTGQVIVGVLILLLIGANALNIAADVVAIGAGMNLLGAGPTTAWALASGVVVTVLVVTGSFELVANIFKLLAAALLAYVAVLFAVDVDWSSVVSHTFLPRFESNSDYAVMLVAVLGTTLSPYLLFWQSLHRVEDLRAEPEGGDEPLPLRRWHRGRARRKQQHSRFDVFVGFAFSNLVMFAIIVTTANTLTGEGSEEIESAAEAASALEPVAGELASTLFAFGFIGSGMLAVPILAGSGAAGLAGLLGRTIGFSHSPARAPVFYTLVLVGTLGGTIMSLLEVNPIRLLVFTAVINGIAAAPFLAVVMLIAGNRAIMGGYVNGRLAAVLGWTTTAVMAVAAVLLFTVGRGGGLY